MMSQVFLWDDAPGGNVEHIAEHGLTPDMVESAFEFIERQTTSRSTSRPAIFGRTREGDVVFVVYELDHDDDGTEFLYVHTAYFAEEE
jgi:hypothetical protein